MRYIIGAILLLISEAAFASCFIEEIVDLHDSGYSVSEIRNQCDGKVDESDCSIGKIVNYAENDEGLSFILKRCEINNSYSNDSRIREQYQAPSSNIASFCTIR